MVSLRNGKLLGKNTKFSKLSTSDTLQPMGKPSVYRIKKIISDQEIILAEDY